MSRSLLWKVSVLTTPEAEEAVAEALYGTFGQPVSSYTAAETREAAVSVYSENRPDWSKAKQMDLTRRLGRIAACGLAIGRGRVSLRPIRQAEWKDAWKRHFKPLAIGSALLLKPSWSRKRARKGQAVVELDPGLSFGTGRHPTTSFCLCQLVARRRQGEAQSFLDVGTGSGILAIAAAKLGYAPVEALDCDPEAVRAARANARRNRIEGKVSFKRQDLTKLRLRSVRRYSLICANLVATLLLEQRERLLARLRPEGALVVAGILKTEFARVQEAFAAAGLRLTASKTEGEWRSGTFVWRG